jgi:hypothetical protein
MEGRDPVYVRDPVLYFGEAVIVVLLSCLIGQVYNALCPASTSAVRCIPTHDTFPNPQDDDKII